ncbi:DNA-3-methyladenine glycosylase [Nonomuraea monospora]|uniref:Putative 3-methyladenine DNA glycosylase n=1 Tax=Nonomuraea monospora TaxID=568818 RepID=A0ABN3CRC9_9ACTN
MGRGELSFERGGELSLAPLPRSFFDRPSHEVAPDLLGRVLVHGPVAVRLTEVEAYGGPGEDPAAHTYRGRTPRNAVMFGPPGHLYVYFTYGMHFCTNLVCLPDGFGSAVLLRAGEVVAGVSKALTRRTSGKPSTGRDLPDPAGARRSGDSPDPARILSSGDVPAIGREPQSETGARRPAGKPIAERDLARGPARLAVALGLIRDHNGLDAILEGSPSGRPHDSLTVLEGRPADPALIRSGPRTGVSTAKETPWRFWIDGDATVSPYRAHVPRRRSAAATSVGEVPRS